MGRAKPKVALVKAKSGDNHSLQQNLEECPLCCEKMDTTDKDLMPCPCGFQVCVFCYWKVRQQYNNSCPGCRRSYDSEAEPAPAATANGNNQQSAAAEAAAAAATSTLPLPKPRQRDPPAPPAAHHAQAARRQPDPPAAQQPAHNAPASSAGLPRTASWASPDALPQTASADLDQLPVPHHGQPPASQDATWPSLADSLPLPVPKPTHDDPQQQHAPTSGSFKSTAQVTSVVSGVRRAVCVPLSLASRAVEPYPEAVELLYVIRQAVQQGSVSSRDGAAQLVQLLREREAVVAGHAHPSYGGDLGAGALHAGFAVEASGGSSASSSPYTNGHLQQAGSYSGANHNHSLHQAQHQQRQQQQQQQQQASVWTEVSGLPGVNFVPAPSSSTVPQHVQALWHEPSSTSSGPSGYGASWSLGGYAQLGVGGAGARYAPPGMQQQAAYKPLSLAN